MPQDYQPRLADPRLGELVATLPAVMVVGARATGKTTTAMAHARTVVQLDRPAEAGAFEADPDAALAGLAEPVLLDEWQAVPGVLGAVKRAVDRDSRAGRFLLTGSVRADLDAQTWPGTGRVVRMPMFPMSERELASQPGGADLLDRVIDGDLSHLTPDGSPPDLRDYVGRALRGGYPDIALRHEHRHERDTDWLDGYLDQVLTRDAATIGDRDPIRMGRFFEALALNTAGVTQDKTLYEAAGINRRTAVAYEQLLNNLFLTEPVPAWRTNRLARLIDRPKRYITDASLAAAALRLDAAAVLRDSDMLGRMLDTFVASQLRPELAYSPRRPRLHHLRDANGRHEIDLVVELAGDHVVGLEVKASAAPTRADARHLIWLRDELGDRFLAGAVLHTGPRPFRIDDRILAVPIAAFWSGH